jgi:hypothetical protein
MYKTMHLQLNTISASLSMIRCIVLAHNVVGHPMVIARALPDSPVNPTIMILHVLRDPLDGSLQMS